MKIPTIITLSIFLALLNSVCIAQLVVDAGSDTAVCADSPNTLTIGGNPTASGGVSPYRYAWSAEYEYAGRTYTASHLLVDTTVANPVFTEPFNDSATFYLTVTDSDQATAIDSITVRFSQFTVCTGDCYHVISLGDSAKLGHCISGGIPPFNYSWTPEESLSDPNLETPWAKPLSNTHYEFVYTDSIGCQVIWTCEVVLIQTGIKLDDSGSDYFQVYPNPISGQSVIEWSDSFQPVQLNVYDLTGRIVYFKSIGEANSSYIDRSDLEKGVLVLEIIDSKGENYKQQIIVL